MTANYTYLFPFEKITQGSRIVIYGAGDVGQEYLQQMLITGYAEVLCFLDRAYDRYPSMVIPILSPDSAKKIECDYIVIAMKTAVFCRDIVRFLKQQGISAEKIVHVGARAECGGVYAEDSVVNNHQPEYAYEKAPLSIALKFGPGLGDAVIRKRIFKEIISMAPEAMVDIYTPGGAKFIKSFYSDEPNLNCAIDDGGVRYAQHHKEYGQLKKINPNFAEQMIRHEKRHNEYGLSPFPTVQNHLHFRRAMYLGKNCYSLYDYTDVFHIKDQKVHIPIQFDYKDEYQRLELGRYITFNYGNGAAGKENKEIISKQWPKEYFEKLARLFKQSYPDIQLVQLGDSHTDVISYADKTFLGKNLELVKYILRDSLLHIDIEGGLMHLATQLGTKCAVIYGPTQVELFSYPQNINIVSDKCRGCYLLYPEYYKCARGLEKPECMWSISPERVLSEIKYYLEGALK